ncbi:MAG: class I SAM-dependent methyltransferase [Anaerolineae bacterium]|nr:class I SAM-dependent methyltransferase [Anaerolineae bacterium]
MPQIVIRHDREKPVIQQHPWIFSGAIQEVRGDPAPGDIVDVVSTKGRFLARGYWNQKSQIQVRILTWQDEPINDDWWRRMMQQAIVARSSGLPSNMPDKMAKRLINAESDWLPGLVVDRYADFLVLQALTLGIDRRKHDIARLLHELMPEVKGIYERSDVDVRGKEGLKPQSGLLWGDEPPEYIEIQESGSKFLVDVRKGHKTGFYLDQSANRVIAQNYVEKLNRLFERPLKILNLCSYTGGFAISIINQRIASITCVDASYEVLELAERNAELNLTANNTPELEFLQADVFQLLRDYVDQGEKFDFIICDPPKFAHNAGQVDKAARGYKDLNLHCFKLLNSGGYLMTFSCSGAISTDLFQKIVFGALVDSGRQGQIVEYLSAAPDHPVALTFPEGAYLKGLLTRVM